uniref:PHD-type domain-containing protein n=1 Tax=Ditylenchus dipsaci TaxID=166011 RepID=A0A915DLD7_9BILA
MSEQERANFLKLAVSRGPGNDKLNQMLSYLRKVQVVGKMTRTMSIFLLERTALEIQIKNRMILTPTLQALPLMLTKKKDSTGLSYENAGTSKHFEQLPSTSSDSKDLLVCSICMNLRQTIKDAEIIQCDKCGLAVHEACYMVDDATDDQSVNSSSSTEPCRLGAFKKADVGGGWVHLISVSWQEIDYKAFGRKPCIACPDKLEARTGITLQCEAGMCKNFYHVTCAQKLGLLVDAQNENSIIRKDAYAKFMRQENARMILFHRPVLNSRQEFKQNVIVVLPAMHNKKTKMLHTSAQFINAFAEKAELLGMDRHQFEEKFAEVPTEQLPNLPPAFSTSFVRYFEHREEVEVPEEEEHLVRAKQSKATALAEQQSLEKSMKVMQEKLPKLHERHATTNAVFNRLCQALYSLTGSHKHPHQSKTSSQQKNKPKIDRKSSSGQSTKKTKDMIESTSAESIPVLTPAVVKPPVRRPNILSRSTPKNSPIKPNTINLENPLKIQIPINNKASLGSPTGSGKSKKLSSRTPSMSPKANGNWLVISPDKSFPSILESIRMHKCHTCEKITDQHLLILCDTCKHHYHIGCLDPPLKRMPTQRKNCGFECSDCACPSTSEEELEKIKTKQEEEDEEEGENASVASRRKVRKRLAVFNSPSLDLSHSPKATSKKLKMEY